jgi:hypothetical protein
MQPIPFPLMQLLWVLQDGPNLPCGSRWAVVAPSALALLSIVGNGVQIWLNSQSHIRSIEEAKAKSLEGLLDTKERELSDSNARCKDMEIELKALAGIDIQQIIEFAKLGYEVRLAQLMKRNTALEAMIGAQKGDHD